MNLVYELLNEPYILELGEFHSLIIENVHEFRRVVEGIYIQEEIKIYRESKTHRNDYNLINKFEVIEFPFNLDFNNKKIINNLVKNIEKESENEYNYLKKLEALADMKKYFLDLVFDLEYPLEIGEKFDMVYFFKALGVKIKEDYDSFVEKIVDYMDLFTNILGVDVFFTVNLTQYLDDEEIRLFVDNVKMKNILVLDFGTIDTCRKSVANKLIFDEDLCRIL